MNALFSKKTEESDTSEISVVNLENHSHKFQNGCNSSFFNDSQQEILNLQKSESDDTSFNDSQNKVVKFTKSEDTIKNINKNNMGNLVTVMGNKVLGKQVIIVKHKQDKLLHRTPLKFGVPLLSDVVIGRDKEIDDMYELITTADNRRVVITSMAGVGKTTLAIHCARMWSSDEKFAFTKNIAVIDAENWEVFSKSLKSLASELNVRIKNKHMREIVQEIFKIFSQSSLLMIYDNVKSYTVIKDYLPENVDNIYVLATSRTTELKSFFKSYDLNVLNRDDSEKLLMSILSGDSFKHLAEKEISELIELFGGSPLGLIQAATYIKDIIENEDKDYSIQQYIESLKEYLSDPLPDDVQINYIHPVYIALKINENKI